MSEYVVEKGKMPNGNTWKILPDEDPESPREWNCLSTFLFFHKRYTLGDKDKNPYKTDDYRGWDELEAEIVKDLSPVAMIDVGMVDHSGLTLYEGSGAHPCDSGGWDSGRIGFALVNREAAMKEFSTKRITKKIKDKCLAILRNELDTYNKYVNGEVYGFVVEDEDGEHLDSCWGFYELDDCKKEAQAAAMCNSPKLEALLETVACVC